MIKAPVNISYTLDIIKNLMRKEHRLAKGAYRCNTYTLMWCLINLARAFLMSC